MMVCTIYACPWKGAAQAPQKYKSEVPEEQEPSMENRFLSSAGSQDKVPVLGQLCHQPEKLRPEPSLVRARGAQGQ